MIKKDRSSDKEEIFALDGIFVQIGLTANSALFKDLVETNRMGEILTDKNGVSGFSWLVIFLLSV